MTDAVTVGIVGLRAPGRGRVPPRARARRPARASSRSPTPTRPPRAGRRRVGATVRATGAARTATLHGAARRGAPDALVLATPGRQPPRRRRRRVAAPASPALLEKPPAPDAAGAGRARRARPGRRGSRSTVASTPARPRVRAAVDRPTPVELELEITYRRQSWAPVRCTTTRCSTSAPTSSTGPAGSPAATLDDVARRSSSRPTGRVLDRRPRRGAARLIARDRPALPRAHRGPRRAAAASSPAHRRGGARRRRCAAGSPRRRPPARRHARRRARRVRRRGPRRDAATDSAPRPTASRSCTVRRRRRGRSAAARRPRRSPVRS